MLVLEALPEPAPTPCPLGVGGGSPPPWSHPGELQRLGGALVIVDRVRGVVVAAESFRLPNRSQGDDTSTGAEAETLVNALRRAILGDETAPAACTADGKLVLSSDNQAAANALRTHA